MPHQYDAVRVAPEFQRMLLYPGERARRVIQEQRELDHGIEPVIRQHRHEAAFRQGRAYESIVEFLAVQP